MNAFVIGGVWFFGVTFGVLTGLAIAQAVTGRTVFLLNSRGISRSDREVRRSGLGWAVYGLSGAVYFLVVGLIVAAQPEVAAWLSTPVWLILIGTLVFQMSLEKHRGGRGPTQEL